MSHEPCRDSAFVVPGFHVDEDPDRTAEFKQLMPQWISQGGVVYDENDHGRLENAPAALIGMMRGANTGKVLVRV